MESQKNFWPTHLVEFQKKDQQMEILQKNF